MKNLLLILLLAIAVVMIYLSFRLDVLPPGLTGVGFIVIAILFGRSKS